MKRDYILIISGIIPLLFSVFILNFFLKDDRKSLFESAVLLEVAPDNLEVHLSSNQFVKFSGNILESNPKVRGEYVIAVREKFVKGKNGKRSEWLIDESYLQPIHIKINDHFQNVELVIAEDYLPCGDAVKISELEAKKSRVLGIPPGVKVSAVGRILSVNPIRIDTGHSLCTGTIEDHKTYLNNKLIGYLFILFCISVPSLALIYLGLFKVSKDKSGD